MNAKEFTIIAAVVAVAGIGVYANGAYAQGQYADAAPDPAVPGDNTQDGDDATESLADGYSVLGCWICSDDLTSLGIPETEANEDTSIMEVPEDAQLSEIQNINDEVRDFGADPCPLNKNSTTCGN